MGRKTAVVTGAGSGVGRARALGLLADGWTVVLTGRRPAALEGTARLAPADDRERAVAIRADITEPAEVDALFADVADRFGRLDLLFNNAADTTPYTPT